MTSVSSPWRGNWRERLRHALAKHRCSTVAAFAQGHEAASWSELVHLLDCNLAPVQLQWMLEEEVHSQEDYDYFVRTALVRELREQCPKGWRADATARAGGLAWSGWATIIGRHPGAPHTWLSVARRFQAMTDLAPDWLPSGPDDPALTRAFEGVEFKWVADLHVHPDRK